ncbi:MULTISPECIES: SspB family protein [unclassified Brucella]|uniref:SspB family protein n=1 Tax=unclassified Brucella TaxID=2632610 RepID=UPI000D035F87|nr:MULTISPECIES: SspB family protein [unclassified Brucella]
MVQDLIRYDILAQEALRGVIRKVLAEVAKAGLPGNHHFFITFLTGAPGVRISSRLKEKYPEQMTIVLQHQFWDMHVTDQLFEVGLSFGDIPEKLTIPFSAIRGFYDPSVNFELEFDVAMLQPASDNDEGNISPIEEMAPEKADKPKAKTRKPAAGKKESASTDSEQEDGEDKAPKPTADVVSLDAFRKK